MKTSLENVLIRMNVKEQVSPPGRASEPIAAHSDCLYDASLDVRQVEVRYGSTPLVITIGHVDKCVWDFLTTGLGSRKPEVYKK